jgi:hypothetical protein
MPPKKPEVPARLLKLVIPKSMRLVGHRIHKRFVLEHALRSFRANPSSGLGKHDLLERLRYGWGNEGWSAGPEFLAAALELALQPNQRILECGSGLSTVLMAIAAQKSGSTLVTLEQSPTWAHTVTRSLARHAATQSATVLVCPLKDYGSYHWYDVPLDALRPGGFTAIICDGPPSGTPGGRFGLLPTIRRELNPGCTIILDDLERPEEQAIVKRWESDFGLRYDIEGTQKQFARLRLST